MAQSFVFAVFATLICQINIVFPCKDTKAAKSCAFCVIRLVPNSWIVCFGLWHRALLLRLETHVLSIAVCKSCAFCVIRFVPNSWIVCFGVWHRAGVLHPNHGTEPVFFVFFHRTLTQNTNFQLYISYTQPAKRRKSMKKNRNLKNKDRSEYKKLHRRSEKKKSRDRRRQLKQGADYHVTCSINNMEHLMKPDEIKVLYEKVLAECKRKYVFLVIHFGIMDNHVHLIIRPGRESLSKIMQWLNSVFAMRFNRLTGRCGHVWKCRFWSKIIDRIEQFKAVFDYISFNPVKAGLAGTPEEYPFCGNFHLANNIPGIITPFWEIEFMYS